MWVGYKNMAHKKKVVGCCSVLLLCFDCERALLKLILNPRHCKGYCNLFKPLQAGLVHWSIATPLFLTLHHPHELVLFCKCTNGRQQGRCRN